jgi:hypothetical protein
MKKIFFFLAAMALAITANAKVTTISPDEENDALRLAVHYAEDGDIIEMTEGTYVQCNNNYVAFDGKAVTVRAAEGANVVLQPQVRITLANGGKATFENIKIDASHINDLADWYDHVIYVEDATEGKELVMEGCEFYGFALDKAAILVGSEKKLDVCKINNCYFHDNTKSCLFFEGATSIATLSVTNSTFANIVDPAPGVSGYCAGVVDVRSTNAQVTVDHCTFYNCLIENTDYAAVAMKGPQQANVVISNNIFMLPEAIDGHRAIRNNVEATNCLTFNYLKDNGGIHSSVTKTNCQLNVDPKFVDADHGNFALAEGSPALTAGTDGKAIGDPRWNTPAVEVVTYTIEGEVLEKIDGRYLTLVAKDETHGDIELNISGYDGLSESYSISGAIDGVIVEGTCTYTVDEEAGTETLVASVATEDATVKYEITLVYTIPAAQRYLIMMTEGIEAVSEVFEWEDVDEEGNPVTHRIASYSWHGANEEWEVYIEAGETIEGAYIYGSAANLTTGKVAELSVVEDSYVIEENYGILSIWGVFTDDLNTYEIYLEGQLPVVEEEGTTKYITAENADIAPGMDIVTDLEIWAEDEDYNTIMIALTEGTTKMYGDYTADELYISYNWETATLLEETVGTYKLDGEVAVFEATVLCGADTLVLSISGTPWVNPATIVPVETVEMKFLEGTVGYSMGTTKIAGTNAEATLNIGIIGANESNMYDQEWSADDLSWETQLTIADKEVSFIYGTVTIKKDGDDKVVTASLLGDDHVLYIITLTTGKELTTGLENLDTTIAPVKAIVNGQLVIIKNGVQYNAQGAVVK